ncbi:MAG: HAMP domain-containing protein [Acidobacteria bacterium]|nr:HAMP domain-containing protein [Acidobacteriota bacterium]
MRNLFVKIFLWFWVGIVLVGVAFVASSLWTTRRGLEEGWRHRVAGALRLYVRSVVDAAGRDGLAGIVRTAERLEKDENVVVFVVDADGHDLLHPDRKLPSIVKHFWLREQEGRRHRSPHFVPWRGKMLVARPLLVEGQPPLLLVLGLPYHPGLARLVEPRTLALRLVAILAIATVLCFWLARYLSAPVSHLRRATAELADGNLSVRVATDLGGRHDEIADLARDFDRMAERLEELVGSQRRLLRDVSHELRSPLARLNVALELARQECDTRASEALERMQLEADRLNDLIGQLLELTRLEGGAAGRERSEVDLAELAEEVAADAAFEAKPRRVEVCVTGLGRAVTVGIEPLLRSAVENVVRNAVRFTAEGTTVEVEVRQEEEDGAVAVVVHDHGPGIPEEQLERIFEPFFRVESARERGSGGVGLGLAIALRAVGLHGGRVTARNHPDGGLEVKLRLPG